MKLWVRTAASFFYIGFLPVAPGTWGSLAGCTLAWVLNGFLPITIVAFSVVGFLICKPAEQVFQKKDPKEFVLDEVVGMMLAVLWLPKRVVIFLTAFILFRVFDVLKPWPISLIQKNSSPLSIMWDDLAAGFAANLLIQFLIKINVIPLV